MQISYATEPQTHINAEKLYYSPSVHIASGTNSSNLKLKLHRIKLVAANDISVAADFQHDKC